MAQIATTPDAVSTPVADRPTGTRGGAIFRHILHNKVGVAGFIIFFGFVLLAILGPIVVSQETDTHLTEIYSSPSSAHWLGTDYAGRDVLRQIVRGGRSIMIVGALA